MRKSHVLDEKTFNITRLSCVDGNKSSLLVEKWFCDEKDNIFA